MGRLIDVDVLIEVLTKEKKQDRSKAYGEHECDLIAGTIGMCIDWIKAIPTAYDVEKVVAELEELERKSTTIIGQHYFDNGVHASIEVVKAGGIDG